MAAAATPVWAAAMDELALANWNPAWREETATVRLLRLESRSREPPEQWWEHSTHIREGPGSGCLLAPAAPGSPCRPPEGSGVPFLDAESRAKSYHPNSRECAHRRHHSPASENRYHAGAGLGLPWGLRSRCKTPTEYPAGGTALEWTRLAAVARRHKYIPQEGSVSRGFHPGNQVNTAFSVRRYIVIRRAQILQSSARRSRSWPISWPWHTHACSLRPDRCMIVHTAIRRERIELLPTQSA